VLERKGREVHAVPPDTLVYDGLQLMAEKNIGALVVLEGEKLVGIISERDYARKVALKGKSSHQARVNEVMTPDPHVVTPDQNIAQCMELMTERQVRHLPVLEGEKLVGIISIGDVVKTVIEDQQDMIQHLERYIKGR
jgi:CBS domain-containing protein